MSSVFVVVLPFVRRRRRHPPSQPQEEEEDRRLPMAGRVLVARPPRAGGVVLPAPLLLLLVAVAAPTGLAFAPTFVVGRLSRFPCPEALMRGRPRRRLFDLAAAGPRSDDDDDDEDGEAKTTPGRSRTRRSRDDEIKTEQQEDVIGPKNDRVRGRGEATARTETAATSAEMLESVPSSATGNEWGSAGNSRSDDEDRARRNRNQLLQLREDAEVGQSPSSSPFFVSSQTIEKATATDEDDDDDPFTVALDADSYLMAAARRTSNIDDDEGEVDRVGSIADQESIDTGAAMSSTTAAAAVLDPSYRAVLETLLAGPAQPGEDRREGGGKSDDSTLQDLVRILEAKAQRRNDGESRSKGGANWQQKSASDAERLHELVFANEDGFLKQSDKFREGLTNPSSDGARQALADKRGEIYQERNVQSLWRLEEQLDRLQQSIDDSTATNSGDSASTGTSKATSMLCPRCKSVLTTHDMELMKKRDTRLCPVCVAEVRLVARKPTTPVTSYDASRPHLRSSGIVSPSSFIRNRIPTTDRPRRVYYTNPTRERVPYPPVPRQPLADSQPARSGEMTTAESSSDPSSASPARSAPPNRRDGFSGEPPRRSSRPPEDSTSNGREPNENGETG